MKKSIFGIFTLLMLLSITFTSCVEDQEDQITATPNEEEIAAKEDAATLEDLYMDTEEEVDDQIEAKLNGDPSTDCPVVTFANPVGTFPNTIRIDYGVDGCEGPNGRIRKGLIVVQQSARMFEPGAVRTITPVGFSIDEVELEGDKQIENNGLSSAGMMSWTKTVDARIIYPNGDIARWQAEHTATLVEGGNTVPRVDNVFEITGTANGFNRNGKHFLSEITSPLVKRKTCRWVESGVRTMQINNKEATLDYGDGSCEPFAEATLPNGDTKTILLKKWW